MTKQKQKLVDIHYAKNSLKQVIARVDFLSPIEGMDKKLPRKITKEASLRFPIVEPQLIVAQEVQFSPTELSSKHKEMKSWNFHGKDRDKTLTINPTAIFVIYTKYNTFEDLKQDFLIILSALFSSFSEVQVSRLGLRYVNNLIPSGADPFSWGQYLNARMLGMFQVAPDVKTLSRALSILEFNFNDFNLRYQFGMPNPDYPAPIKQKFYVLDLDAYYQGLQESNEIEANLTKFHDKIQELFEQSITDELRGTMNG